MQKSMARWEKILKNGWVQRESVEADDDRQSKYALIKILKEEGDN